MSAEHELTDVRCALSEACRLLELARCPNADCTDGTIPHGPNPDGGWEAEQCQWCAEKDDLVGEHG